MREASFFFDKEIYTANVLTIETMDFNHVPNPTRIWAKTIETVVIIHNYLDLLVSENYGLLPIETIQNHKVHSQ